MRKNKDRFTGYFLLSILVVIAFLLPAAWAQVTDAGTVLGTVADSSGAIVPGVSITLRDPESNLTYKTVTDESGEFRFLTVPAGPYELTAEKKGFTRYCTRLSRCMPPNRLAWMWFSRWVLSRSRSQSPGRPQS